MTGLTAANYLHMAGHQVTVLEKEAQAGGKLQTVYFGDMQYDVGFQVLQTAYPEVEQLLDLNALDLRPFLPGAMLLLPGGYTQLMLDPRRTRQSYLATLRGKPGLLKDKIRLWWLSRKLKSLSAYDILNEQPYSRNAAGELADRFSSKMFDEFLKPFFSGVLLNNDLDTDYRYMRFLLKMFSDGAAALPARGIAAVAQQLADRLPAGAIKFNEEVIAVSNGTVKTQTGTFSADKILLTLPAHVPVVSQFLNEPFAYNHVTQFYFLADVPPFEINTIAVNCLPAASFNNLTVYNFVHPNYAPGSKFLISVSTNGLYTDELAVRKQIRLDLATWFGREAMGWEHIRTFAIENALPAQYRSNHMFDACRMIDENLYLAGDYLLYGSLNAAMLSGRVAAQEMVKNQ